MASRIVTFTIEARQVGMLLGMKGSTKQRIEENTSAQIRLDERQVTVTSPNDQVLQRALSEIRLVISFYEITIEVPVGMGGRIIGRGGETIKSIREKTGTRIDLPKDSPYVKIEGKTEYEVEQARQIIVSLIGSTRTISVNQGGLPSVSYVNLDTKPARCSTPKTNTRPDFEASTLPIAPRHPEVVQPMPIPRPQPVLTPTEYRHILQLPHAGVIALTKK